MNIRTGLERVSAIWWGLCALVWGAFIAADFGAGNFDMLGTTIAVAVVLYLLHRGTCWVVRGLFSDPATH